MPVSEAFVGYGSKIGYETSAGSGVYTTLGEVKSIKPGSPSAGEAEVTHLESPGGFKEFLATLKDGGEVAITINLVPSNATWTAIKSKLASGVREAWQIQLANTAASKITYAAAFVKQVEMGEISAESPAEATITLRIAGDWTWS